MKEETEHRLQVELENLPKRGLPDLDVEKIREFIDDLKLDGISAGRQYAYVLRLKRIATIIPDKFLNPSERDLKSVMAKIGSTKVKWGAGEPHLPTDNGIQAYRVALKRFYKWHLGKDRSYPECVEWIKIKNVHPSRQIEPEMLITKEDENSMIKASENARDRAIISTLYDSGVRVGELGEMKIKSVTFDQHGVILRVPQGKTGFRQVRVVGDSIPYLRAWLSVHPDGSNPEAWLFCSISEGKKGMQLNYYAIDKMIKRAARKGGVGRRVHTHLFRHTRATMLASRVMEAPLESQMGWVHGSKQTRTYVHLSLRDQDNAILKGYGVPINDEEVVKEDMPVTCPRCRQSNPSNSSYCNTCGLPFDIKTALEVEEAEKQIEKAVEVSTNIDSLTKKLIKESPKDSRIKLLTILAESLISDPKKQEDFFNDLAKIWDSS